MTSKLINIYPVLLFTVLLAVGSCVGGSDRPKPRKVEIVKEPEKLEPAIQAQIAGLLEIANVSSGRMEDIVLHQHTDVSALYGKFGYTRLWSSDSSWHPYTDSLLQMISAAELYGLFPNDYHARELKVLFGKFDEPVSKKDAALWARGDLLLSDAFVSMARHLRLGRIPRDSITLHKDSVLPGAFYIGLFEKLRDTGSARSVLEELEPAHPGYKALRAALPWFLDSLDRTAYTYIEFPYQDSLTFARQLQRRLFESSYITFNTRPADSAELSFAVRKYQADKGLTVDGKPGNQVISSLNNTGLEQFRRIAINLDRYKHLPDSLPTSFIWVNLPAYKMEVWDSGNVVLESKVIIGQPKTRTPVLNSMVSNFITYPQWTVPYSIIFKEMLPKIREDVNYLNKENLMVVDQYDSVIDPATIDWSKLNKKNFPYLIRQRQGDDNSLGVIKFNFRNKYDVYLHDTNARSLFSKPTRALSHGCVRVQEWDSLSRFLLAKDTNNIPLDTVSAWLMRQEKHTVPLRQKVPVYLRYITSEAGEDGRIRFHSDIYGEDKALRMKYFGKS
jgi:murein L,D-transpeptidase YcbB/YkuD